MIYIQLQLYWISIKLIGLKAKYMYVNNMPLSMCQSKMKY